MSFIIGLCGPSGSGKTTLARMLAVVYEAKIISLDDYFLLDPPYKKYENNGKNWELPENVDWVAINKVADAIQADKVTMVRKIDWILNTYTESLEIFTPVTIVEGFLLLHDDALVQKMDLSVFIDVSDHVGLERRILREKTDENRKWFEEVTFPEYTPRRELFKQKADLVLNGEDSLEQNFAILQEKIRDLQLSPKD